MYSKAVRFDDDLIAVEQSGKKEWLRWGFFWFALLILLSAVVLVFTNGEASQSCACGRLSYQNCPCGSVCSCSFQAH